jgi:hypothetical protein
MRLTVTCLLLGAHAGLLASCNSTNAPGDAAVAADADVSASQDATYDDAVSDGEVGDVDSGAPTSAAALRYAFDLLNGQRIASGLPLLTLDPVLSDGCAKHVAYMVAEARLVREEEPSRPAYSEAGAKAAKNALLASGMERPKDAILGWIDAFYHRVGLLDPGVSAVGLAFDAGYACLDLYSAWQDPGDFLAVPWPGRDQVDVPTSWTPVQGITPRPFDVSGPTGPLVSLTFAPKRLLGTDFVATLTAVGDGVPLTAVVRLPLEQDDPFASYQRNSVIILPLLPLEAGTTYDVFVEGTVDAAISTRGWSFTTAGAVPPPTDGQGGASSPDATTTAGFAEEDGGLSPGGSP